MHFWLTIAGTHDSAKSICVASAIQMKRLYCMLDSMTNQQSLALQAALKEFDTNHDGQLNPAEFERFARKLLNTGPGN